MVWASTKDLPNNRNYVVKNRQIKIGAQAKLSPTLIIRNFEINWGIFKRFINFLTMFESLFIGCDTECGGRGEWLGGKTRANHTRIKIESRLGSDLLSSGFCKIARIARLGAGPDQTGAGQDWLRSETGQKSWEARDGWQRVWSMSLMVETALCRVSRSVRS